MWLERLEVSDTVHRYFLAMDEFDWAAAGEQLADRVTLDASAFDVPAREVSREQYLAELIARNGGYEVSLHMNADHVVDVDGDHARVRSHFFGAHSVGPDDAAHVMVLRFLPVVGHGVRIGQAVVIAEHVPDQGAIRQPEHRVVTLIPQVHVAVDDRADVWPDLLSHRKNVPQQGSLGHQR